MNFQKNKDDYNDLMNLKNYESSEKELSSQKYDERLLPLSIASGRIEYNDEYHTILLHFNSLHITSPQHVKDIEIYIQEFLHHFIPQDKEKLKALMCCDGFKINNISMDNAEFRKYLHVSRSYSNENENQQNEKDFHQYEKHNQTSNEKVEEQKEDRVESTIEAFSQMCTRLEKKYFLRGLIQYTSYSPVTEQLRNLSKRIRRSLKRSQYCLLTGTHLHGYLIQTQHQKDEGTFGDMNIAIESSTGLHCALKTIPIDAIEEIGTQEFCRHEIECLRRVRESGSHPNIIQPFETFLVYPNRSYGKEKEDQLQWANGVDSLVIETAIKTNTTTIPPSLCIASELAEGGDLQRYFDRVRRTDVSRARHVIYQIASALDFLHNTVHIAHRDIQLSNILISFPHFYSCIHNNQNNENDNNNNLNNNNNEKEKLNDTIELLNCDVKICDFGLAIQFEPSTSEHTDTLLCGAPQHCPPEMFTGDGYKGPEVDVFALGVCLYRMLAGRVPFRFSSDTLMGALKLPESIFDLECRDLLQQMLHSDPQHRANINQVLNHSWFH